jgi:hypothetical protein
MKTGYKKFTANSENFNCLQALRNTIKDSFYVANVKWGGFWNGMNWENFSFFCTPETLAKIESFCNENELSIEFSK